MLHMGLLQAIIHMYTEIKVHDKARFISLCLTSLGEGLQRRNQRL